MRYATFSAVLAAAAIAPTTLATQPTSFVRSMAREDPARALWLRDLATELLARYDFDPNMQHPHLPPVPPPEYVRRPHLPSHGGRSRRDTADVDLWAREPVEDVPAHHDPNMLHPHWPNEPPPEVPPSEARPPSKKKPRRHRREDTDIWARVDLDELK